MRIFLNTPRFSSTPMTDGNAEESVLQSTKGQSSLALAKKIIAETDASPALRELAMRFVALRHGKDSKQGLGALRNRLLGEANNEFGNSFRAVQWVLDLEAPHAFFNRQKPQDRSRSRRIV